MNIKIRLFLLLFFSVTPFLFFLFQLSSIYFLFAIIYYHLSKRSGSPNMSQGSAKRLLHQWDLGLRSTSDYTSAFVRINATHNSGLICFSLQRIHQIYLSYKQLEYKRRMRSQHIKFDRNISSAARFLLVYPNFQQFYHKRYTVLIFTVTVE